jgi:glycolate oxidase iron-sulfur subunit
MNMEESQPSVLDELAKCNRCGFCLVACPVYQATGIEAKAPRGRNFLARVILEQRVPWTVDAKESLFQCLGCRACVEHCFPAVETNELMVSMRSDYHRRFGQPWIEKFLFHNLLPNPQKLGKAIRKASLLKSGATLVRSLSFIPWFRWEILKAVELLPPLPKETLRERWKALPGGGKGKSVAYFGGCAFNFVLPDIGRATLGLLGEAGCPVVWPEHVCCGLPAYGHGDLEGARRMARKNLDAFRDIQAEAIVTECASCSSFLKKYPTLFAGEPGYRQLAETLRTKVKDISEFLSSFEISIPARRFSGRVTFHDPCHLNRFQKIKIQPRTLLRKIEGLTLVEMGESEACCGGGSSLNLSDYDLSMKILQRKMENIRKTGADVLVTSCPGCYLQLRHGVKKNGLPMEVCYLTEMLAGVLERKGKHGIAEEG